MIDGLTVDEFACALLTYAWDETRGNRPAVLHLRRELRGHLVGGTKLYVTSVHEHAIAQVVVAAAGATQSATIDTHALISFLREWHRHTLHALVDADDGAPVRSVLGSERRTFHHIGSRVAIVVAAAAILIVRPGQVGNALCLCRHIFDAGCQSVVHIGKKIVALIPSHLRQIHCESERHCRVARVASALVHLPEIAIGTCLKVAVDHRHDEISQKLREAVVLDGHVGAVLAERATLVVFEVRHRLVINEHIVAEDANHRHTQRIAQSPVRPIVSRCLPPLALILPCAVTATQEAQRLRIPHLQHPALEQFEVLPLPTFVVAHELGSLRKLIAVEAAGESIVRVATDVLRGVRPRHEDAYGGIGVRLRAGNLPAQRVLIRHSGSAAGVHVVFARTASAYDDLHGICLHARLGVSSRGEHPIGFLHGGVAGFELCLHAVEVGLRVEPAGMNEPAVGVVVGSLGAGELYGQQGEGEEQLFHDGFIYFQKYCHVSSCERCRVRDRRVGSRCARRRW